VLNQEHYRRLILVQLVFVIWPVRFNSGSLVFWNYSSVTVVGDLDFPVHLVVQLVFLSVALVVRSVLDEEEKFTGVFFELKKERWKQKFKSKRKSDFKM
jgi:hypothetical protein